MEWVCKREEKERMEYTDHVTGIDQSQSRIAKWRHALPTDPGTELNERVRGCGCGCGMGLQARGDRNLLRVGK